MRIAVDVDGVLADRIGSIVDRVTDTYGVALDPADVDEYDFSIPETDVDIHHVIEESTRDPDHLLGLDPVEGAIDGMRTLYEAHELVIATHRPRRIHAHTECWLRDHDIPYDEFVAECGSRKCDLEVDALIDDRPANVRAFTRRRGRGILFRQPWNDDLSDDGPVTVVSDWAELVDRIAEGPPRERE
jgi:5'(3')-deoxyribonucleotidase